MDELTQKYRTMFLLGAIFNVLVSTSIMVPQITCPFLGISPVPEHSIFLHVTSAAIGCMGLGYFLASQDFPRNSNLIVLGTLGKIHVNVLGMVHVFVLKTISWQVFLLSFWDLIWAVFYTRALLALYEHQKADNKKAEKKAA